MGEYDISKAFDAIERELMTSMIRNLDRHKAEENELGIEWSQWQAEQLKRLEQYKIRNRKKFGSQFADINRQIDTLIRTARESGGMEQEIEILKAIRNGFKGAKKSGDALTAQFFRTNDRKIEALIKATTDDMKKAETAILRMADDKYRQILFNAQVYANTGAGTYEKAVDMATKDMLSAGLNCVEYANGARHTLADYADMAIRTACKRAYLTGEGEKRKEWGISTVIMNKRGNPCPKCLPWVGKIMIDDVWSGGKRSDGNYPLMSTAVAAGLYHPRCKDGHTTYFEGISTPPDSKFTRQEIQDIEQQNKETAEREHAERQAKKYGRIAKYSLDKDNREEYGRKAAKWERQAKRGALTEEEEGAIIRYVSPDSYMLNDKLRRRAVSEFTEAERRWMREIDRAIEKLPCYEGNLNRSLTFAFDRDAKNFFDSMNIGEEYIPRQYLSTTKKGVYNDGGQVQIYIQNAKKGKDLGRLSIENEILYPIGTRFHVVNKVEMDGQYLILLEEV